MKELTSDNFNNTIKSEVYVIIDFWSEFCMQCVALEQTLKILEEKYKDKIKLCSANVGHLSDLAGELNITALPTLIFLKNGKEKLRIYGNRPQKYIEDEINKLLGE
jgi:thioredoxin 1